MSILDSTFHPYEFTAYVSDDGDIPLGTAVEFTTHRPGDSVPVVKAAAADTDDHEDAPRTTYVGVARQAGAVGDLIAIRPWSIGTMPALTSCPITTAAGSPWFWNGTAFELWDPTYTDYTADTVGDDDIDEVYLQVTGENWVVNEWSGHELEITEAGHPREGEFYTVVSNTDDVITINSDTPNTDWDAPIDFRISNDDTEGFRRHTAINMTQINAAASPQIAEFMVVKGGRI